ncbi:MAG: VCBS repeat-containing protein, partial [Bacteroidetes bacterium]|nr:VCBS repeat-containing protein [Bacteroidota bacterium]
YRNTTSEKHLGHYLTVRLNGTAPNTLGFGARVTLYAQGNLQVLEQMPCRGFESCVEPVLHFGLASATHIDSLTIRWPDLHQQTLYHLNADTTLTLNQTDATETTIPRTPARPHLLGNATRQTISGPICHHENAFIDFDQENLIPKMLSTEGPRLAIGDVNGDGLKDFIMGNAAGDTARLFLQTPDGRFTGSPQPAFAQDKDAETIGMELFDADNDGDLDLVAASGGGQEKPGSVNLLTRLYLNDGKGHFTRSLAGWPPLSLNASCIRTADFDGDGFTDVFIGGRSLTGSYGRSPGSVLLKNLGKGAFTNVTPSAAPELATIGMVTDARWADLDGDGQKDLAIVGDWMPLTIFSNHNGHLTRTLEIPHSSGWWNCLAIADMDGDGRPDLIAGNNGLNSKLRADENHPARLFSGDFSNNGRSQCIAAYYRSDGKSYPINLRSEITARIPSLKKKFLRYDSYAGRTLEEVLSEEQRRSALQLTVEQTQSAIFYNEGHNNYTVSPLPLRAQFSAVFAIAVKDLNGDGKPDLLLAGNFYGLKPEIGRYDASYGTTLLNVSPRRFRYLPPAESGFFIRGEVRDIQPIGPYIIASRNNDSLQIFKPCQ